MATYSEMQKASRNFFRACMKHAADEFVREVKQHEYVEMTDFMEEIEDIVAEEPTREDTIKVVGKHRIFEVEKEDYVAAFDTLNETEKTIIHSYYYGKATDKEIGEALGKSRSTIWEQRKGALEKMRRYLSEKEAY